MLCARGSAQLPRASGERGRARDGCADEGDGSAPDACLLGCATAGAGGEARCCCCCCWEFVGGEEGKLVVVLLVVLVVVELLL